MAISEKHYIRPLSGVWQDLRQIIPDLIEAPDPLRLSYGDRKIGLTKVWQKTYGKPDAAVMQRILPQLAQNDRQFDEAVRGFHQLLSGPRGAQAPVVDQLPEGYALIK